MSNLDEAEGYVSGNQSLHMLLTVESAHDVNHKLSKKRVCKVDGEEDKTSSSNNNEEDNVKDAERSEALHQIVKRWPKQVFCICANEFCERFSFYGMRAVLTLYLVNVIMYSSDTSTAIFHGFVFVAYASPIIGSIIADGYIGKYWTIVSISCLYAVAQIMLTVASTFPKESNVHPVLDLISMVLVGLATGGIKPCVSSFGADQFPSTDTKSISIFFSLFYFAINSGALISSFITPILRVHTCLGYDSCFPLAFGVPAGLMVVAIVVFLLGTPCYIRNPPEENIIAEVFYVIMSAIRNKASSSEKEDHWLDYAMVNHDCESDERCSRLGKIDQDRCPKEKLVYEVKGLFRVIVLFLPVPIYFALFDQQGSRWILQAVSTDGQITSSFSLYPDQMIVFNPLLVVLIVPLFQAVIYPGFAKIGVSTTLLQRMSIGGFIAAATFVVLGLVQLKVDKTLPDTPNGTHAFVSVINSFPSPTCNFTVKLDGYGERKLAANNDSAKTKHVFLLYEGWRFSQYYPFAPFRPTPSLSLTDDKESDVIQTFRVGGKSLNNTTFSFTGEGSQCPHFEVTRTLNAGKYYIIVLTPAGWTMFDTPFQKTKKGGGQFSLSVIHLLPCQKWASGGPDCTNNSEYIPPIAVCVKSLHEGTCRKINEDFYTWSREEVTKVTLHDYSTGMAVFDAAAFHPKDILKGTIELLYLNNSLRSEKKPNIMNLGRAPIRGVSFTKNSIGGVYALTLTDIGTTNKTIAANVHMIAPDNKVSILWQVPAYVLITISEVLFSISGLELAYQEASKELKSVVSALWLVTVAIGNLIVMFVAEAKFSGIAVEFFSFGAAMAILMVIFALIASYYYEYREKTVEEGKSKESEEGSRSSSPST